MKHQGAIRRAFGFMPIMLMAAAGMLVNSSSAMAFTLSSHEAVTQEALGAIQGFAPHAIGEIQLWNVWTDMDNSSDNDSGFHFAHCCWTRSTQYIRELREDAGDSAASYILLQGTEPFWKERAFKQIGRMMHIVQDFFAHSNWVEQPENAACRDLPDLRPSKQPAWWYSYSNCCKHPTCCSWNTPSHSQMNKDAPGRPGYDLAYCQAVRESRSQWWDLEDYVNGTYPSIADDIISLLKGYDPCKQPPGPDTNPSNP